MFLNEILLYWKEVTATVWKRITSVTRDSYIFPCSKFWNKNLRSFTRWHMQTNIITELSFFSLSCVWKSQGKKQIKICFGTLVLGSFLLSYPWLEFLLGCLCLCHRWWIFFLHYGSVTTKLACCIAVAKVMRTLISFWSISCWPNMSFSI